MLLPIELQVLDNGGSTEPIYFALSTSGGNKFIITPNDDYGSQNPTIGIGYCNALTAPIEIGGEIRIKIKLLRGIASGSIGFQMGSSSSDIYKITGPFQKDTEFEFVVASTGSSGGYRQYENRLFDSDGNLLTSKGGMSTDTTTISKSVKSMLTMYSISFAQ